MKQPCSDILTGQSEQHLVSRVDGVKLHRDTEPAFAALCLAARQNGIDIKIVSAYRSFARQAEIWRAKITGQRAVYNQAGEMVDVNLLTGKAKLDAVLLYSALPGASRHHWGTEFDVYDAAAVPDNYAPRLDPLEYGPQGPFFGLQQWLSQHAGRFGFFLPYASYRGGVAAEPWHLSYQPVASHYLANYSATTLRQCLLRQPIAEQQLVLENLDDIVLQYVCNICPAGPIQTLRQRDQTLNSPE
jgi:LAS superfamily LD-carboxypeptidase LdcB